jgi:SAM-dependent methyltransferase
MPTTTEPNPLAQPLPWDLVADGYVDEIVPVFERFAERALALATVTPGARVLDVASGPGTLALVAAERGAEVTAVDFSTQMIERLRTRAAARGIANVRAIVGDGQQLDFPDATFDAAFSLFGVIFFPDRARGLREMARVLRPGGHAVVSSWPPLDRVPVMATVFSSLRDHMPGLPLGGGRPPLGGADEIRSEMGAAGFAEVRVEEVAVTHEFPAMTEAWRSISRSTAPLVLLRRTLGPDASRALEEKLFADLVARFGPGPVRLDAVAFLGSGRRAR